MEEGLYGYEKEDWFKLTEEQQMEVVRHSIGNKILNTDIWYKLIEKHIIPKLIKDEEYEMVDVFTKIKEEIKKDLTDGL